MTFIHIICTHERHRGRLILILAAINQLIIKIKQIVMECIFFTGLKQIVGCSTQQNLHCNIWVQQLHFKKKIALWLYSCSCSYSYMTDLWIIIASQRTITIQNANNNLTERKGILNGWYWRWVKVIMTFIRFLGSEGLAPRKVRSLSPLPRCLTFHKRSNHSAICSPIEDRCSS